MNTKNYSSIAKYKKKGKTEMAENSVRTKETEEKFCFGIIDFQKK